MAKFHFLHIWPNFRTKILYSVYIRIGFLSGIYGILENISKIGTVKSICRALILRASGIYYCRINLKYFFSLNINDQGKINKIKKTKINA